MIHFFVTFTDAPEITPLATALQSIGTPYRLFGERVRFHFRTRLLIPLVGYPKLAWFALRTGIRSFWDNPRPGAVAVYSDVEVLVLALLRLFLPGRRPAIALIGFIFTERSGAAVNRLRQLYYGFVLARCRCIICHSRLEAARYAALFPRAAKNFVFVPWGGTVTGSDAISAAPMGGAFRLLAAGRSGRDYPTLAAAIDGTGIETTVICDNVESLGAIAATDTLHILRHCYDNEYLAQLAAASAVVVPLAVDNISAGQMVLIQAMAMGRPVVATNTPSITDYITDGVEGLLVPRGDSAALRGALLRLRHDPALVARLGKAGRRAYLQRFSEAAYLRQIIAAVGAGNPT
jgi:glycosyltransferase involved in cell wall biosynthesis